MSWVDLPQAQDGARFGGKAMQLGAAIRAGLPVPPGRALAADDLARLAAGDAALQASVAGLIVELGAPLAARSSAIGEDSAATSFAGQHLSVLHLRDAAALREALVAIHASAHSEAARAYRQRHAIGGEIRMGVVVQRLVDPRCAGVLFTENPLTRASEIVIEASWGLGEAVVAGLVTPDHYRLAPDGRVLEARVGEKDLKIGLDPAGGTREESVPDALVHARCLDDAALATLAALARRCQAVFGPRLDLEWAFVEASGVMLLQARPITTSAA